MKPLLPSRGMISGELSWAFVALCFAVWGSGLPILGDGWFYERLVKFSHPPLWASFLAAPAILIITLDLRELVSHRLCIDTEICWTVEEVGKSALLRGRACLCALFGWAYMVKVLVVDVERGAIFAILATAACAYHWWFYKENRRVRREIRKRYFSDHVTTA